MAVKKKIKQTLKDYKEKTRIKCLKIAGYTYKNNREKPIIFILSTGRCGSTSIKRVFNQNTKFLAFHEEIKPFVKLSTELAENPDGKTEIYKELDYLFENLFWPAMKDQIIVHSDHRMWNLVPYLSNYFPNAFFIHLIRNPIDSVKSYIQRNWYLDSALNSSNRLFDQYRLYGHKVGHLSIDSWQKFNQVEKCLWYWNYVNETINGDLTTLENSKHAVVLLENFIDDINATIKKNYHIDDTFSFKDVQVNKSKSAITTSIVLESIELTIKKTQSQLFLTYYPNLTFKNL